MFAVVVADDDWATRAYTHSAPPHGHWWCFENRPPVLDKNGLEGRRGGDRMEEEKEERYLVPSAGSMRADRKRTLLPSSSQPRQQIQANLGVPLLLLLLLPPFLLISFPKPLRLLLFPSASSCRTTPPMQPRPSAGFYSGVPRSPASSPETLCHCKFSVQTL